MYFKKLRFWLRRLKVWVERSNMKYQLPYTIISKIIHLIAQISENIGCLTFLEEIKNSLKLRKANRIRTIQGLLAIEGNTLSTEQITEI